jgi:hypothetical protein
VSSCAGVPRRLVGRDRRGGRVHDRGGVLQLQGQGRPVPGRAGRRGTAAAAPARGAAARGLPVARGGAAGQRPGAGQLSHRPSRVDGDLRGVLDPRLATARAAAPGRRAARAAARHRRRAGRGPGAALGRRAHHAGAGGRARHLRLSRRRTWPGRPPIGRTSGATGCSPPPAPPACAACSWTTWTSSRSGSAPACGAWPPGAWGRGPGWPASPAPPPAGRDHPHARDGGRPQRLPAGHRPPVPAAGTVPGAARGPPVPGRPRPGRAARGRGAARGRPGRHPGPGAGRPGRRAAGRRRGPAPDRGHPGPRDRARPRPRAKFKLVCSRPAPSP